MPLCQPAGAKPGVATPRASRVVLSRRRQQLEQLAEALDVLALVGGRAPPDGHLVDQDLFGLLFGLFTTQPRAFFSALVSVRSCTTGR